MATKHQSKNKTKGGGGGGGRVRDDDSDTDSDNEILMKSETNWPRFLIVESASEDLPLQKLSPFAVHDKQKKRKETVMARLHIGHSFLAHSFSLKGEKPPVCIGCDKPLTTEHI